MKKSVILLVMSVLVISFVIAESNETEINIIEEIEANVTVKETPQPLEENITEETQPEEQLVNITLEALN